MKRASFHEPSKRKRDPRFAVPPIGEVLRLGDQKNVISLAAGAPAVEALNNKALTSIATALLTSPDCLTYGDASGYEPLRDLLAAEYEQQAGVQIDANDVVLTHGSQQGLHLVAEALLDGGDVLVDRPSYVGALQTFRSRGARIYSASVSEGGSGLTRIEHLLATNRNIRLIYVVANFGNPTGYCLTMTERDQLIALARKYRVIVVEDDAYGDLYYSGDRPPLLARLDCRNVVTLGTFSKTLAPAMRLGYIIGPTWISERIRILKENADLGNSQFLERLTYEYLLVPGLASAATARARDIYQQKRDVLALSLRNSLSEYGVKYQIPRGGFFIWAEFPNAIKGLELLRAGLSAGVSFVPGEIFYAERPEANKVRLAFSSAHLEDLERAGPLLAQACSELLL